MDLKTTFSEGRKEGRRRRSLSRDSGALKAKQADLSARLAALGRRAWDEKVDLGALPELKGALESVQARLDDLKMKTDEVLRRKGEKEKEKSGRSAEFDAQCGGLEEKIKDAGSRLNAETEILKKLEKSRSQAEGRSSQLSKEREQLKKKVVEASLPEEQRIGFEKRLRELALEETDLLAGQRTSNESIKAQAEKVVPLQAEVDGLNKQVKDVKARQKESNAGFDRQLAEIQKELDGHQAGTKEAEKAREEQLLKLGEALAARNDPTPCLGTELAAVRETEKDIEGIKGKIAELDGQKSEAAAGAYRNMWLVVAGGIALVAALVVLAVVLF